MRWVEEPGAGAGVRAPWPTAATPTPGRPPASATISDRLAVRFQPLGHDRPCVGHGHEQAVRVRGAACGEAVAAQFRHGDLDHAHGLVHGVQDLAEDGTRAVGTGNVAPADSGAPLNRRRTVRGAMVVTFRFSSSRVFVRVGRAVSGSVSESVRATPEAGRPRTPPSGPSGRPPPWSRAGWGTTSPSPRPRPPSSRLRRGPVRRRERGAPRLPERSTMAWAGVWSGSAEGPMASGAAGGVYARA